MSNQANITEPLKVGLPVYSGPRAVSASTSLSAAAVYSPAYALQSDLLTIGSKLFGVLTNDCSLVVEINLDGNAATGGWYPFKTYDNARIAAAAGFSDTFTVKAAYARLFLVKGTLAGANGLNTRFFD